ncbi:MAG: UMP kinase [Defluviitaleaceae bacterium]|nr:UMP kinase [Defluviitaleaceae bacterium]
MSRIIVKISGEALGSEEAIYENNTMNELIGDLKKLIKEGHEIGIVVGGGNIWRGAGKEVERTMADQMGMLATVMNAIYFKALAENSDLESIVYTPFPAGAFTKIYDRECVLSSMKKGNLAIFAGGTGHPFFSTDTIPALRALELHADRVLFAKNIDGVYDKDPNKHENAVKYEKLTYREVLDRGLEAMDLTAIVLLEKGGIDSVAFPLNEKNSIYRAALEEEGFGTKINSR